jgi:hypothetical protein
MREFLTTRVGGRLVHGWFWVSVLLVLPNCTFDPSGLGPATNLWRGVAPHNDLVFCDIEKPSGRHCATPEELARGIRLSEAAVALAEGRTSDIGLDDSEAALTRCSGVPETVQFQGPFPQGFAICLNCAGAFSIADQPDITAMCKNQCLDFFGTVDSEGVITPEFPPSPANVAFCAAVSRPSVNMPNDTCFLGGCNEGSVNPGFSDPRRIPEPVIWTDPIDVVSGGAEGNDLTRPGADNVAFDAGAVSEQHITKGDGWVEFSALQADLAHFAGLQEIAGCPAPCTDSDPGFADITYAIFLRLDGRFYVYESGTQIDGPDLNGSWGTYTPSDRFRVRVRDNGNNTATISYSKLVGPCMVGTPCNQTVFYQHVGNASYPLRVDTSMRQMGAALTNVRILRIK